jgi:secondary thiamine-phosphate synthase enzyme
MNIQQKEISLQSRRQGIYLITDEVVAQLPELRQCKAGFLHLFMLHTSASLSINENADPTVRHDMHRHLHELVPENAPYYKHTLEGADDMPAHIKATITDTSLTIPVRQGQLWLGTWQGIYLLEHRYHAGSRKLAASLWGMFN